MAKPKFNHGKQKAKRKAGYKSLTLTLQPRQMVQDEVAIRQRLSDFNFTVDKIMKDEGADASYILVFQNCELADNVFRNAAKLDYKLRIRWPNRPSPGKPIKYISLKEQQIREGKSLNGEVLGILPAYKIVTVNQIKGRRARFMNVIDGREKNIGWVSVHNSDGETLLMRVCEYKCEF